MDETATLMYERSVHTHEGYITSLVVTPKLETRSVPGSWVSFAKRTNTKGPEEVLGVCRYNECLFLPSETPKDLLNDRNLSGRERFWGRKEGRGSDDGEASSCRTGPGDERPESVPHRPNETPATPKN